MVNNPEKLEVIEKFAKEENLLGQMEKRKQLKKQMKSMEKPQTFAYAPPPPPMPAPPIISVNAPILRKSPKPDTDVTDGLTKKGPGNSAAPTSERRHTKSGKKNSTRERTAWSWRSPATVQLPQSEKERAGRPPTKKAPGNGAAPI